MDKKALYKKIMDGVHCKFTNMYIATYTDTDGEKYPRLYKLGSLTRMAQEAYDRGEDWFFADQVGNQMVEALPQSKIYLHVDELTSEELETLKQILEDAARKD